MALLRLLVSILFTRPERSIRQFNGALLMLALKKRNGPVHNFVRLEEQGVCTNRRRISPGQQGALMEERATLVKVGQL